MRKQNRSKLNKKLQCIGKKDLSINLRCHQSGEQQQCAEVELTARNIIKYYNNIKHKRSTQRTEAKLHKVYTNLICVVNKLFTHFFDLEVSRQLGQILNKLVYFYESPELADEKNKQNAESLDISHPLTNCNTTRINSNIEINIGKKLKQFSQNGQLNGQLNGQSNGEVTKIKSTLNTHRPSAKKQENGEKNQNGTQFRVFMYEKLKEEYNKFRKEKEDINCQIQEANRRIQTAFEQIDGKIRNFQMKRVIETNSTKFAVMGNKNHKGSKIGNLAELGHTHLPEHPSISTNNDII